MPWGIGGRKAAPPAQPTPPARRPRAAGAGALDPMAFNPAAGLAEVGVFDVSFFRILERDQYTLSDSDSYIILAIFLFSFVFWNIFTCDARMNARGVWHAHPLALHTHSINSRATHVTCMAVSTYVCEPPSRC